MKPERGEGGFVFVLLLACLPFSAGHAMRGEVFIFGCGDGWGGWVECGRGSGGAVAVSSGNGAVGVV